MKEHGFFILGYSFVYILSLPERDGKKFAHKPIEGKRN
jgi:hypothetical protein